MTKYPVIKIIFNFGQQLDVHVTWNLCRQQNHKIMLLVDRVVHGITPMSFPVITKCASLLMDVSVLTSNSKSCQL